MTFPDDDNGGVLRRLFEAGDDMTTARDINFSVVFADQTSAARFVSLVKAKGWTAVTGEVSEDVTVTRCMVPDHRAITACEAGLERLAHPLGGYNDGWGCLQI